AATDESGRVEAELVPASAPRAVRLPRGGGPARLTLAASAGPPGSGLLVGGLGLGVRRADAAPAAAWRPARPPNVLVYLLDALRRDGLGCYGGRAGVSPNIDRLAAEGVVFDDAVAQGSWTRPAVASLLTGLIPVAHGVLQASDSLGEQAITLTERLHAIGYRTI